MFAKVATFLTLKQLEQSELARCVVLLSFYSLPEGQLHGVVVSTVSSHQMALVSSQLGPTGTFQHGAFVLFLCGF